MVVGSLNFVRRCPVASVTFTLFELAPAMLARQEVAYDLAGEVRSACEVEVKLTDLAATY